MFLKNKSGVSLSITSSAWFGHKLVDEHLKYGIELRVGLTSDADECWLIFRRYSQLRRLHDTMSRLYPSSFARLVFPARLVTAVFGASNAQLAQRRAQLEHYLRCFVELIVANEELGALLLEAPYQLPTPPCEQQTKAESCFSMSDRRVTRRALCAFCPFFAQTEADLAIIAKINKANDGKI